MKEFWIFVMNNWLLFLALVFILGMLVMNSARPRLLGFREVKPAEAVRVLNDEDVLLLDVREDSEFSGGHIINARHIPLAHLEARMDELEPAREKHVMVYCRSGARAARAASILTKKGFSRVSKLDGGVMAWQNAGLPLEK